MQFFLFLAFEVQIWSVQVFIWRNNTKILKGCRGENVWLSVGGFEFLPSVVLVDLVLFFLSLYSWLWSDMAIFYVWEGLILLNVLLSPYSNLIHLWPRPSIKAYIMCIPLPLTILYLTLCMLLFLFFCGGAIPSSK